MHWNEVVDHGDAALVGALRSRHVNEHLMVILIITMRIIFGLMRLMLIMRALAMEIALKHQILLLVSSALRIRSVIAASVQDNT